MNHLIFISYASPDVAIANKVLDFLEGNQIQCWMAPRDIVGGMEYGDVIDAAIHYCKAVVIIFSKNSNDSQWVKGELNVGFSAKKAIIPYKIDTTELTGSMRLMLNDKHWIFANQQSDLKLNELLGAVNTALNPTVSTPSNLIQNKKSNKKIVVVSTIVLSIILLIVSYSLVNSNKQKKRYKEYNEIVCRGDSLANSGEHGLIEAMNNFRLAEKMEVNIPENSKYQVSLKISQIQNSIDSIYYQLIQNGDIFANLGSANGNKQAIDHYQRALSLKESELVKMKLNDLLTLQSDE